MDYIFLFEGLELGLWLLWLLLWLVCFYATLSADAIFFARDKPVISPTVKLLNAAGLVTLRFHSCRM